MSANHATYISRYVIQHAKEQHQFAEPIESFRKQIAYVLLGEPGSGKSTLFEREAAALGDSARYTTVRDFLRSELDDADRRRTLFIDAMDEQRAADGQLNQPLDRLITKLQQLGRPNFRLSCRAADWLNLDTKELESVSGHGQIVELQLQPLSEAEIERLLQSWTPNRLSDPVAFIEQARQNGLESMLGNPMLLDLLVSAVSGDAWPASRTEIFQLACQRLAEEHNESHERLTEAVNTDELLDDAGMLCAILLLSDRSTYRTSGKDASSVSTKELTRRLGISAVRSKRALNTTMFVAVGAERWYRHRSIAEYLAARALLIQMESGLPITRILALMSGAVGGIVDSLRGLYAWLVSFSHHREVLIQYDVLAVVYYGDVRNFNTETKRLVFEAIHSAACLLPGLGRRDWQSEAFGGLGTSDMESYLVSILMQDRFEDADEVLLLSVLEAIEHGQTMPRLLSYVAAVAGNARHWDIVRQTAVEVLVAKSDPQGPYMSPLLAAIRDGTVEDSDDELAGRLLNVLYPAIINTRTLIWEFLLPPRRNNFFGSYRNFWHLELWNKVPKTEAVILIDSICEMIARGARWDQDHSFNDLYCGAILHAACSLGADLTGDQLYHWIASGLNEHGYRAWEGSKTQELSKWLIEHPDQLKAVYECGLVHLNAQAKASQFSSWQHVLLKGMPVPDGWYAWLLQVAALHVEEEIVRFCFGAAAWAAANSPDRFPNGLDQIYAWTQEYGGRWPAFDDWCEAETSTPLDDWRRDARAHQIERAKQIASDQVQRREALAPALKIILSGGVSPGLMHDILVVMERGGYGVDDVTPVLRVQSFLVSDKLTAQRAIDSLIDVLGRDELPSWSEVIELNDSQKTFLIQPVCLYAADEKWGCEDSVMEISKYPYALTLLAFSLVAGRKPKWFSALASSQPEKVAAVMKTFLSRMMRRCDDRIGAVQWLDSFPPQSIVQADVLNFLLARMTIPFEKDFPKSPIGGVLQSAIKYSKQAELELWIQSTLSEAKVAPIEQTVALAASLAYSDDRFDELLALVSGDLERAAACCHVFDQPLPKIILSRMPISLIGRLVRQLGQLVSPRTDAMFSVRKDDSIRTGIAALLAELASRTSASATLELFRLQQYPELMPWRYKLSECQIQSKTRVLEATFGLVDPLKVAEVLCNREPATELDLVAFVLDHVDTLMRRIQFAETNMVGIFWREDKTGNRIPQTENVCRDRFLHLLNLEMKPMGIHIGKEQPTARDKRSDMAITLTRPGRHMSVPVEVKLDSHPNVWHAWNTQLMDLYAPDPDSGYHGVYLVMFAGHKTRLSPTRMRPSNAEAMAQAFSQLIPPAYLGRLHGMVLDFSWA
ncbi:hypothetical protein JAB6_18430 [Janthinobacterium sp. HH104]|uniref:NACHT domain-containing protein n=1 Tax=Janthinobacterium sp. HH104 TaxID=1537276 RepID=UPI000893E44A|nr:hypothetical protein [Janthinobacterium sp. HH104]OEZ84996.1 hypothetical protein JAB6_18430 [Janthinobacterium sp. HH104]